MKKFDIMGYSVEVDEEITRKYYEKSSEWSCECLHCRNFLALAREKKLPKEVLEILDSLGIPPEKATYVCQMIEKEKGHLYQFSYRISGNILAEKSVNTAYEWGEMRCTHEIYPYGAPDFPKPHFDLEFWLELPMILEE